MRFLTLIVLVYITQAARIKRQVKKNLNQLMRWGNTNSRDYQKRIALSSRNYATVNSWNIDNREIKYFPANGVRGMY